MSLNDTKIELIISRVVSGQATIEEKNFLCQRMKEDPTVHKLYSEMKNIWDVAYPSFPDSEIDVKHSEKVILSRIAKKNVGVMWFPFLRNTAAIIAIPLLIATSFFFSKMMDYKKDFYSSEIREIFSSYGSYSLVYLPDSSRVWLNSGTSLKYPIRFLPNKREVILDGEAFFEVKADAQNPFIINTENIYVKALGTKFNIESYREDSITAITMVEGKVDVLFEGKNVLLQAQNRIHYNRLTKDYSVEKTASNKWYAWKDGKMIFRDDPLEHVFKRIGQIYNIDIKLTDPEIGKHLYRATFKDESLDEILKLLKMTVPIQYIDSRNTNNKDEYMRRRIEVQQTKQ